jgi:ATP-binding cassette subfamily C protein CydD
VPVTTDPAGEPVAAPGAWLSGQVPGWYRPSLTALALVETAAIAAAGWQLASVASAVFAEARAAATLNAAMLWLLAALVLRAAVAGFRRWVIAEVSIEVRQRIRREVLEAVAAADPRSGPSSGEMVPLIDEQVETLDRYFAGDVPLRINALVVPLCILVLVFANDWLAGLLLALSAPLIPLFMALVGMGAEQAAREQQGRLSALSGWFLDRIRGAATLRLFRAEQRTLEDVQRRTEELRGSTMKVLRLAFLSSAVMEFFAAIAIATVAIYVGLGLFGAIHFGPADQLTLQSGLFILLLAPEFFQPLRALSQAWHDRSDARAASAAILDALALPPARPAARTGLDRKPGRSAAIELRGVGFGYPGRAPLFGDLNLEIASGERVVLVGPSGGGKSTLIALLAGFIEPQNGDIRIDGTRLASLTARARAAHVAWLGQQPWLFRASISENIRFGAPDADPARLHDIAETAGILQFSRALPDGLASAVGEGGHGLSGGQAQRVALARALLRPKPLILLDEPTASLDPDSESDVLEALSRLLETSSATVVCASHRPGLIQWADRVLEVEGGRVRERPR